MDFTAGFLFLLCLTLVGARKNVLFIVADDMRPEIKAYGNTGASFHPNMYTPNLDALAAKSLVLKNAFVQQAVCGPSRTSLLTGRRPDTTHVYDIATYWRDVSGNFTTLPQYFKENGYETGGMGKIFHPGEASGYDDPASWTLDFFHGEKNFEGKTDSWKAIKDGRLKDFPLVDEQVADAAIETLANLSSGEKPFFLAVGFHKPHLPFVFPESMLDFYPEADIEVPDNLYVPENMPEVAWSSCAELRNFNDMSPYYNGTFNLTIPSDKIKELRRAYYAAVTWVDVQVGRVLQQLEVLGLANSTVVSFWGDHGWQLGEHAEWCKSTNFELATRVPMMVHVPGLTDCGIATDKLTEAIDLFPTIIEAAGLPSVDQCGDNSTDTLLCSEGSNLLPLAVTPDVPVKTAAFSQFPRERKTIMGYSMRTERYRYTEWVKFDRRNLEPDWSDPSIETELYDHSTDPEENFNVAEDQASVVATLSAQLRSGWRSAIV